MRSVKYRVIFLVLVMFGFSVQAGPIDINTANAEEIAASMSGIGPAKAKMIVEYRTLHGAFASIDEISQVRGVGQKTLEKNRKNIYISKRDGKAKM